MSTTKKNNTTKQGTGSPDSGRRILRRAVIIAALVLFCALIVGAYLLYKGAKATLFTQNRRFDLKTVRIVSQRDGYWNGKERQLAREIGLKEGDNLFAQDSRDIREKLGRVAGIESAQVVLVLPDTVELRLTERFPRAQLMKPNSCWVVDEKGFVIPREKSMAAGDLPLIIGPSEQEIQDAYNSRRPLESVLPGLDLIMAVLGSGQNFSIKVVRLTDPDKLVFWTRYRDQKNFQVIFPRKHRDFAFMLSALESTIINAANHGDDRAIIDLSFKGQAVIR